MQIRILFLGPARDFSDVESASINIPDAATVGSMRAAIAAKFPRIGAALATTRIAVNQSFVADEFVLQEGDEVALIPPVSGG